MIDIFKVESDKDLKECVYIISESFKTVAKRFNLTKENCPNNGAFITFQQLKNRRKKNQEYFFISIESVKVGFIALEVSDNKNLYIEKLAVLPEYRNQNFANLLLGFALDYLHKNNLKDLFLSLIDEDTQLKKWYIRKGYKVRWIKKFKHLPFKVCFMKKELNI